MRRARKVFPRQTLSQRRQYTAIERPYEHSEQPIAMISGIYRSGTFGSYVIDKEQATKASNEGVWGTKAGSSFREPLLRSPICLNELAQGLR